jgi:hypothetical protein
VERHNVTCGICARAVVIRLEEVPSGERVLTVWERDKLHICGLLDTSLKRMAR